MPMHAKCGQMHVHLLRRYIGPSAAKGKCTRTHVCAHMCSVVTAGTPRRHNANNNLSPSQHPSPRRFQQMLPDPHATPRFHGGLLVLSRRGRAGFFGAHNEPQGQVWTSLHGFVASACPTRAGAGYSPLLTPSRQPSASFARVTSRFPPFRLPLFFPRELLKTGDGFSQARFLPPLRQLEKLTRGSSPVTKGEDARLRWGLQQSQRLAMLFGNVYSKRRCNRIFSFVEMEECGRCFRGEKRMTFNGRNV